MLTRRTLVRVLLKYIFFYKSPWGKNSINLLAPVYSNDAVDRLRQLSEPNLAGASSLRGGEKPKKKKSVTFLRTDWDSEPVNFNDKDHPSVDQVEYFERDWAEIHAVKNNLIGTFNNILKHGMKAQAFKASYSIPFI